jgi:hypothetical protein
VQRHKRNYLLTLLWRSASWLIGAPAAVLVRQRQQALIRSAATANVGNLTFRCEAALADEAELLLGSIIESLNLIHEVDEHRFDKIWASKPSFLVCKCNVPRYLTHFGIIMLPYRKVLQNNRSETAATIIHEAVHARMYRAGLKWWPDVRDRMEARCFKEERLFFQKLQEVGWDASRRIAWTTRQIDEYTRSGRGR